MTLTIRGVTYSVRFVKRLRALAEVTAPTSRRPVIRLRASLKNDPYELMRSVLHEVAHAALWDLDEQAVDEITKAQAEAVKLIVWPLMKGVK